MPATPAKLYIVAGEPSGDRLGGSLLSQIRSRRTVHSRGVGGEEMLAQDLQPLFEMSDLSVMGFADVFAALPRLLWRMHQVVQDARRWQPDAVVLIDNQVFSALVAKRLRRAGYRGPILLYVAPSVWAWKPERAKRLAPVFDEILAILPFEPRVMRELDGPVTHFVGHPAEHLAEMARESMPERGPLALLPGSRGGELRRHMPLFAEVAAALASHPAISGFVLPTLPHLAEQIAAETAKWPVQVDVVSGTEARREAFAGAVAAVAGAGTVTLELALTNVPTIGTYVPDALQMRAFRKWGKPLIALPNIILGEMRIPEIEPGPNHADRVADAVRLLLDGPGQVSSQLVGFEMMRRQLAQGLPEDGRQNAADRVLHYLNKVD